MASAFWAVHFGGVGSQNFDFSLGRLLPHNEASVAGLRQGSEQERMQFSLEDTVCNETLLLVNLAN